MHVFSNTDLSKDLLFFRGPLDILDHSSDNFSFGGKAGIDATIKHQEENGVRKNVGLRNNSDSIDDLNKFFAGDIIKRINSDLFKIGIPLLIVSVKRSEDPDDIEKVKSLIRSFGLPGDLNLILAVDESVDIFDLHMVAWQVLGNSDPVRDHDYISSSSVFIDGTIKARKKGLFPRRWPNVVCSDIETIALIDKKWESLGLGPSINSPSLKYLGLCRSGKDEII